MWKYVIKYKRDLSVKYYIGFIILKNIQKVYLLKIALKIFGRF